MKYWRRMVLTVIVGVLLGSGLWAAPAAVPSDSPVDVLLQSVLSIQLKKVTLTYLADPRSKAFLKELLKDLPPLLQKNFKANITGAYRKVLLENYANKQEELSGDLGKVLAKLPGEREKVLAAMENTAFPLNLGFAFLAKKLADHAQFAMGQRGHDEQIPNARADFERLQKLLAQLGADAAKDSYDSVKALYAKTPVRDFPIHWYDDMQHRVDYTTHGDVPEAPKAQQKKQWTVLVFLNADNDLEQAGLNDINEMEKVGSNDSLNIVVQIDRLDGGKGDTIADKNWVGARRYYVNRDFTKKIASTLVMNLGERDMGHRQELADFLTWGIETYPAEKFVAVIWNHGAGWHGISSDDDSGHMLSMPDVLAALKAVKPALAKVNPKHPKFDIIDFDACLMGMIEVAYELRETADYLVASEETEPGAGMPYKETLSPIRETPGLTPKTLAKHFVDAYVKSYAMGGSATNKYVQGSSVTKSAYDLSRIAALAERVGTLGTLLRDNHAQYTQALVDEYGQFARIRRYDDTSFVDLFDLCRKLAEIPTLPEELRKACLDILANLGYPKINDRLAQPITIKRRSPGAVVWGINGWRRPPDELCPSGSKIYRSRFIRTPLKGPDEKGDYVCQIGPFGIIKDPVDGKRRYVQELNFRVAYDNGKSSPEMTSRTGREYQIVTKFPEHSPLIAEGHTQGMGNSYGLSIYFPYCLDFRTSYKTLQFAKDFNWDEFIARIPEYRANAKLLLTGQMVEDPSTLIPFVTGLKQLGVTFDVLWDPRVFGYRFRDILEQYKDGAVFTDSISKNSFESVIPSADDFIDYLNEGGALLVAAQSAEQANSNSRLLEEYFHFSYVEDDRELPKLKLAGSANATLLTLNGEDSARSAGDVTIMQTEAPGKPFVQTEDGRLAGIAVQDSAASGNAYRGIFLGFRFEAITGAEARAALLKSALEVLLPASSTHPE